MLIDSFDEIYLSHKDVIIHFLKLLLKTCIEKIVITTRPNVVKVLEENFNTFSCTLNQLTKNDQKQYLTNYFVKEYNFNLKNQQ